ncbi:MAG: hypothetical protein AB7L09_10475 [Nitrospira sp.]
MLDLSVYGRYLANDDDLFPELTRELLDACRALQRENVQLRAKLAEQKAGRAVNGTPQQAYVHDTI